MTILFKYDKFLILVKPEKIKRINRERKSMKKKKYLAFLLTAGMVVQAALPIGKAAQVQAAIQKPSRLRGLRSAT